MLLDDLATYLEAQGVVSTGWVLCKGYLPPTAQDQVIALFETGGRPPDTLGRENQRPNFMIRVRAAAEDYEVARNKWQDVFDALQDAREVSGSPTLLPGYTFIMCDQSGPLPFFDDRGRHNLTANFRVHKSRTS